MLLRAVPMSSLPSGRDRGRLPIVPAGEVIADPGFSRRVVLVAPASGVSAWPYLNPAPPVWRPDGLVLPVPGCYVFREGEQTRAVIAAGHSALVNATIAFSFVAAAVTGRSDEEARFYAAPDAFAAEVFERPGTCHVNCGPAAQILGRILAQLGIRSRLLQWIGAENLPFHQSLEVALPQSGWTLYDPHFGVAYRPGASGLFVFEALLGGASVGAEVQLYLPKWQWFPEPWNPYRRLLTGFGIFSDTRDGISLIVGDVARFRARWRAIGMPLVVLTPAEFRARFYQARDRATAGHDAGPRASVPGGLANRSVGRSVD